jgi:ribosome-associated protein
MVAWRDAHVGDEPLTEPIEPLPGRIAQILSDKQAEDITILDMRDAVSYTDWFVIASGRNARQTQAMAGELRQRLKDDEHTLPARIEGQREGTWILLDYLDAVVHIFTPDARSYYRLDQLWGQVPAVQYAV